ncbi:forkhead box protein J1-B-like [Branchiostoma floridae x Branchiostoma belcheri]|nr:Forkhead box protein J1 [Branchiostoma belcheri]
MIGQSQGSPVASSKTAVSTTANSRTKVIADKFKQNWMAQNPQADSQNPDTQNLDDSLTSLSWLQNLNIMKIPTPPSSPKPADDGSKRQTQAQPAAVSGNASQHVHVKEEHKATLYAPAGPPIGTPESIDKIDYKTNPYVKPPYSYATLICMAMKETKKSKITLSDIYKWIKTNFKYYEMAEPSWQNSIRHNLSLNKCFTKVPRSKNEPGKGGFWKIDPQHADMIVNGTLKKRRPSSTLESYPPAKKIKKEEPEAKSCNNRRKQAVPKRTAQKHNGNQNSFIVPPDDPNLGSLKGDLNWNAILNDEITVDGIKVKTEDILGSGCALTRSHSPLLTETSSSVDSDIFNDDPLDLTIRGISIPPPPEWLPIDQVLSEPSHLNESTSNILNTNLPPSPPSSEGYRHPWEEASELDSIVDMNHLFESLDDLGPDDLSWIKTEPGL